MTTLVELKKNKEEILAKVLKEEGREGVMSLCAPVLDKRAYFSISSTGRIKRKPYNYSLLGATVIEDDNKFLEFILETIDFRELTKIEKIGRMTNATDAELEKNILKLLSKGEVSFLLKPMKELYIRNSKKAFEMMMEFSLMDDMSSLKTLAVLALERYFEKFGYSDEMLYLTLSFLSKLRGDFYEFERASEEVSTNKDELRKVFKENIDRFKNKKGLQILSYLTGLLKNDYKNENIYINILKNSIDRLLDTKNEIKELNEIETKIFVSLSEEV